MCQKEGCPEYEPERETWLSGKRVTIYDRYRFAIPVKGVVVREAETNDGVEVRLTTTNTTKYLVGCTIWVDKHQLRIDDPPEGPKPEQPEQPDPTTLTIPIGEPGQDFQSGNFLNAIDFLCRYFQKFYSDFEEIDAVNALRLYADGMEREYYHQG